MLSSTIIKIGEYIYRIYPYKSPDKLEIGNAYVFGGSTTKLIIRYNYVLPFRGKYSKTSEEPGIYLDKDENIRLIHPKSAIDKSIYSTARIMEITPDTITNELNKYLQEVDVNDLRYNGNIFAPKIKESDDVGIKAIRLALLGKQIDFGSYKNRFTKPWAVSNTRKALLTDTTLTFTKLDEYAKIFDFGFGIIIFDKKHAKDPMSDDGKALVIFNDDEFPLTDPLLKIVHSAEDVLGEDIQYTEDEDEEI